MVSEFSLRADPKAYGQAVSFRNAARNPSMMPSMRAFALASTAS
jgi:hypothetical protein